MLQNAGSIYTASCIHCKRCQNAMRKGMFYNMKCGKLECKRYAFTTKNINRKVKRKSFLYKLITRHKAS
ncbi:unknown [Prevotella sp. CAG:255]|nr:unknown [Prevotella sp. CAG:255]